MANAGSEYLWEMDYKEGEDSDFLLQRRCCTCMKTSRLKQRKSAIGSRIRFSVPPFLYEGHREHGSRVGWRQSFAMSSFCIHVWDQPTYRNADPRMKMPVKSLTHSR